MNKTIYTISFNCYASCRAFLKKNSVVPSELIEKGNTFIKVDSSFMKQANWINSSYVYQIKMNYKTLLTRYKLGDNWIVSESFSLEESLLSYRKLLKARLIKDRPQRFSFQYRFKHQSDWISC